MWSGREFHRGLAGRKGEKKARKRGRKKGEGERPGRGGAEGPLLFFLD